MSMVFPTETRPELVFRPREQKVDLVAERRKVEDMLSRLLRDAQNNYGRDIFRFGTQDAKTRAIEIEDQIKAWVKELDESQADIDITRLQAIEEGVSSLRDELVALQNEARENI